MTEQWLTAEEAARVLRVTERQVNRYGQTGRLKTRRAGRRVFYLAADVAKLADEQRVDLRPALAEKPNPAAEALAYLRQRQETDAALIKGQDELVSRLDRIERQLQTPLPPPPPALPRWALPVMLGLLALLVVLAGVILFRLF